MLSTALYFVVFGSAIGSRIERIGDVTYGTFVPGLIMLSVLTPSISNASFGIYFPKFTGTIYELLSAPISHVEIVLSYVGAAATKSVLVGLIILATAAAFVPLHIAHPVWMLLFLVLAAVTFSLFGFIIDIWGRRLREAAADRDAAHLPGWPVLFDHHAAADVAEAVAVQPIGLPDQRLPLELLRQGGDTRRHQLLDDGCVLPAVAGDRHLDHENRLAAEGIAGCSCCRVALLRDDEGLVGQACLTARSLPLLAARGVRHRGWRGGDADAGRDTTPSFAQRPADGLGAFSTSSMRTIAALAHSCGGRLGSKASSICVDTSLV